MRFILDSIATASGTLAQANADAQPADTGSSGLGFLSAGGTIGFVIILLSFGALALLILHLIRIRAAGLAPQYVVDDLTDLLKSRRIDEAITYCREDQNACLLAEVMDAGLTRYRRSPFGALELKAALEEAGQSQFARLSRSLDALSLIAAIAPMLGLLGTVVGINGAFGTISSAEGFARPDQLAGDISLALVTTIMGLTLAIPTTAAVTYFRNRIEKIASDVAIIVDELALYVETPPQRAAARPAGGAAGAPVAEAAPAAPQPPVRPATPTSN
ncbi:MAG: MotA/TolQ/ExbB proton channel family protein [Phycisphaerales bacterium JB065]